MLATLGSYGNVRTKILKAFTKVEITEILENISGKLYKTI
jgi:uncharacterized protein with GYD domain